MSTIISATIIINLVLSLFLPGQIPSYARTVNSQTGDSNLWDDWSLSTTIAGDPPLASGSTSISVSPSGSAGVSGTGTSSAIQLTSASHTFIDDGVPNNYAGLWHMDNNWNDSSGNGNNGTANDGATFNTATPRVGVAAGSFDGTGDFISIPYSSSLNIGSGNLSLEAWVKISQQGLTHHIFIMDDNNDVIKLQINISNKATFYTRDTGGDNMEAISTTTIAVDTWYHIVGVREGTTVRIYVNGVLEHSATNAAVGNIVTTDHWHIGTGVSGADTHVNFFKGNIDEAAIYNTNLSTAIILNHYNASAALRTNLKVKNSGTTTVDLYQDGDIYAGSGNTKIKLIPSVTESASAVVYTLDTENALSTAGAKLLSVKNNGTEKFGLDKDGIPEITQNSTGAGTPLLGANCPAVTVSAPYTWIKMKSSDGSTVYIPAWK